MKKSFFRVLFSAFCLLFLAFSSLPSPFAEAPIGEALAYTGNHSWRNASDLSGVYLISPWNESRGNHLSIDSSINPYPSTQDEECQLKLIGESEPYLPTSRFAFENIGEDSNGVSLYHISPAYDGCSSLCTSYQNDSPAKFKYRDFFSDKSPFDLRVVWDTFKSGYVMYFLKNEAPYFLSLDGNSRLIVKENDSEPYHWGLHRYAGNYGLKTSLSWTDSEGRTRTYGRYAAPKENAIAKISEHFSFHVGGDAQYAGEKDGASYFTVPTDGSLDLYSSYLYAKYVGEGQDPFAYNAHNSCENEGKYLDWFANDDSRTFVDKDGHSHKVGKGMIRLEKKGSNGAWVTYGAIANGVFSSAFDTWHIAKGDYSDGLLLRFVHTFSIYRTHTHRSGFLGLGKTTFNDVTTVSYTSSPFYVFTEPDNPIHIYNLTESDFYDGSEQSAGFGEYRGNHSMMGRMDYYRISYTTTGFRLESQYDPGVLRIEVEKDYKELPLREVYTDPGYYEISYPRDGWIETYTIVVLDGGQIIDKPFANSFDDSEGGFIRGNRVLGGEVSPELAALGIQLPYRQSDIPIYAGRVELHPTPAVEMYIPTSVTITAFGETRYLLGNAQERFPLSAYAYDDPQPPSYPNDEYEPDDIIVPPSGGSASDKDWLRFLKDPSYANKGERRYFSFSEPGEYEVILVTSISDSVDANVGGDFIRMSFRFLITEEEIAPYINSYLIHNCTHEIYDLYPVFYYVDVYVGYFLYEDGSESKQEKQKTLRYLFHDYHSALSLALRSETEYVEDVSPGRYLYLKTGEELDEYDLFQAMYSEAKAQVKVGFLSPSDLIALSSITNSQEQIEAFIRKSVSDDPTDMLYVTESDSSLNSLTSRQPFINDYRFISVAGGIDSESVLFVAENGYSLIIEYGLPVGQQLAAAGLHSGVYTVYEVNVYGYMTSYQVYYLREGDPCEAEVAFTMASGRTYTVDHLLGDGNEFLCGEGVTIDSVTNPYDDCCLVTIEHEGEITPYISSDVKDVALTEPGLYTVRVEDRVGNHYSFALIVEGGEL